MQPILAPTMKMMAIGKVHNAKSWCKNQNKKGLTIVPYKPKQGPNPPPKPPAPINVVILETITEKSKEFLHEEVVKFMTKVTTHHHEMHCPKTLQKQAMIVLNARSKKWFL